MNNTGFSASYDNLENLEKKLIPADAKKDNRDLRVKIFDYFACYEGIAMHISEIGPAIGEKDFVKLKRELDIQTNEGYLYSQGKKYGKNENHKIKVSPKFL